MRPATPPERMVAVVVEKEYWKKMRGYEDKGVPMKKNSARPEKGVAGRP